MNDSKQSIYQLPGAFEEGNLLVIDGDAFPYMFGWHHREHQDKEQVYNAIDQWMKEFFLLSAAHSYIGVLGAEQKCFRYQCYKYKPYKGNRPPKEDWVIFWEPVIRQYLVENYGFQLAPNGLETDDVVATLGISLPHMLSSMGSIKLPYICSPDKDLKQIPGHHLDYRKVGEEGGGIKHDLIDPKQAKFLWCMQMLTGDTTDNIAGIPGMGEVKAKKLLEEAGELMWKNSVKLAYQKYFGPYYGEIIYAETEAAITLVTPSHPLWSTFGFEMEPYLQNIRSVQTNVQSVFSPVE